MSDIYDGPAVLINTDGDEIAVHARLGVTLFTPSWTGVIEADSLTGRRLSVPGTIRYPDGSEDTYDEMSGDSATPDRVEVKGGSEPHWART